MNDQNEKPVGQLEKQFEKKRESRWKVSFKHILLIVASLFAIGCFAFWFFYLRMPGESFSEKEKTNSNQKTIVPSDSKKAPVVAKVVEATTRKQLEKYIRHLSESIGERNLGKYKKLCEAADYLEAEFKSFGYSPKRQTYKVMGLDCFNIDVEIKGTKKPEEIIIIGGHYDSVTGTPGANDNGSGTAATLVLANHFKKFKPERTLRFVAWTNEEPPYFQNRGLMGSWVYAVRCSQRDEQIKAVISLETMGYFTNEKKSQKYPIPLNLAYPSTGNFIGFVANDKSIILQRRVVETFRKHAKIPSEGAAIPEKMPIIGAIPGIGWSDHWSFWQEGYAGLMVTDTALFRYPHYHLKSDTIDKINFEEMTKAVDGLKYVIEDLTNLDSLKNNDEK